MTPVWVMLAAAVGAPSRYLLDRAVTGRHQTGLPFGTALINVLGSFVLGLLTGLALHDGMSTTTKTILGTGFCGAFTTFSTFSLETVRLAGHGRRIAAVGNVVGSVAIGLGAAAAGLGLALL